MNIGLIDVDNNGKIPKFPNLALMKISAFHKRQGHHVEFANPIVPYDRVYMSKVFDFTEDIEVCINANEIIRAGVGYGVDSDINLLHEIEHIMPDYDLYNIKDTAYGFMTRGCPRDCSFCNVTQHQGHISRKVADLNEFWNGQKNIVLLDPNILACKDWKDIFQQLIDSKADIDFSQGIDIRLMTEEKALMIKQMRIKMIHFAWDQVMHSNEIIKKLKMFKAITGMNKRKTCVYVLTNYDTTHEFDLLRVNKLISMGYDPYVMIYDKWNAPRKTRLLQRWVNNKIIFRSCERFEDYDPSKG